MSVLVLLLRQRLRRDWRQLLMWIGGTGALAAASVSGVSQSFRTPADQSNLLITVLANPIILVFRGLPSGPGDAAVALFLILPFLALMAGFMSSFLAVRHTRAEEESGRAELVAAAGAGRFAPFVATVAHGILANLALAAVIAATFIGLGFGAEGSILSAAATGVVGVSALGVGLLAAELMPSSRAANSFAVWLLMAMYLLAGIGNAAGVADVERLRIESALPAWLSPFGWAEQSRPFADNEWWPLLLPTALAVVVILAATIVRARRDAGSSLFAERTGRADAGNMLSGVFGLAWRLNRAAIVGWAFGGLVTGALATKLASVIRDTATDNPTLERILQAITAHTDLQSAAVVVFFTMLGVLASAAAVQVIAKARQEEAHGTTELLWTSPVSRVRWLGASLTVAGIAIVGTCAAALFGATLGLASQSNPSWAVLRDAAIVSAGEAVAAAVFATLTALVLVLLPRLTIGLGWGLVMAGMLVGLFGPLFGLDRAIVDLAPIASVATIDGDAIDWQNTGLFAGVVTVGVLLALALVRRREHQPSI
ncbi:MAG TPA: polyketide antibiotic transporter [Microbacteriaceae bacterium]|nr:polyketide antibiotic transporter [Microbacteriaceae bacterium]